jgi:hypothetical protein
MSRNQRLDRLEQAIPEFTATGGCRQCTPGADYRQQVDWARAFKAAAEAHATPVACERCGAVPDYEGYRAWVAERHAAEAEKRAAEAAAEAERRAKMREYLQR